MTVLRTVLFGIVTLLALPWLLLTARFRRFRPSSPRRVLVIQRGKLGDLVCVTPLLRALARRGDHVTVLCLRGTADVLAHNPHVAAVLCEDDPPYRGTLGRFRLMFRLFAARFDAALGIMRGGTLTLLGLWTAAPLRTRTLGGSQGMLERLFGPFFTHRFAYRRHQRTFDHYMRVAAAAGAAPVPYRHELFLMEEEDRRALDMLHGWGLAPPARFAALSLRAGNAIKVWPLERFVEVARHLIAMHGYSVLFLDTDPEVTRRALSLLDDPLHAREASSLSLRELFGVLRRASLFVSVDTGPLYVAHAFDVPLVDIVGPVDPAEQAPLPSSRVALVLPPPPCRPCSFVADTLRVSTEEQKRCLDLTTAGMVNAAVDGLLRPSAS